MDNKDIAKIFELLAGAAVGVISIIIKNKSNKKWFCAW